MTEEFSEDSGVVTEVQGNKITVEIVRGGGCKSCAMQGFCFKKNTPARFTLTSNLPLQTGDLVQLDISPAGRTLASLLIFGLPLVCLFTGFLIASQWLTELASILLGLAALAASFLPIRWLDKKLGNKLNIGILRKL